MEEQHPQQVVEVDIGSKIDVDLSFACGNEDNMVVYRGNLSAPCSSTCISFSFVDYNFFLIIHSATSMKSRKANFLDKSTKL